MSPGFRSQKEDGGRGGLRKYKMEDVEEWRPPNWATLNSSVMSPVCYWNLPCILHQNSSTSCKDHITKAQWFSTDPKICLIFSFKPCSPQNMIYKSIDAFIHTLTHRHMHISESKGYVLQILSEFKGTIPFQIYQIPERKGRQAVRAPSTDSWRASIIFTVALSHRHLPSASGSDHWTSWGDSCPLDLRRRWGLRLTGGLGPLLYAKDSCRQQRWELVSLPFLPEPAVPEWEGEAHGHLRSFSNIRTTQELSTKVIQLFVWLVLVLLRQGFSV